jgi:hypothetical protein
MKWKMNEMFKSCDLLSPYVFICESPLIFCFPSNLFSHLCLHEIGITRNNSIVHMLSYIKFWVECSLLYPTLSAFYLSTDYFCTIVT